MVWSSFKHQYGSCNGHHLRRLSWSEMGSVLNSYIYYSLMTDIVVRRPTTLSPQVQTMAKSHNLLLMRKWSTSGWKFDTNFFPFLIWPTNIFAGIFKILFYGWFYWCPPYRYKPSNGRQLIYISMWVILHTSIMVLSTLRLAIMQMRGSSPWHCHQANQWHPLMGGKLMGRPDRVQHGYQNGHNWTYRLCNKYQDKLK